MTIETLRGRYRLHRFPPRQRAVTGEPLTASISAADYQRQLMDGFQEGLQKGFAQGMTEGQEQGFSEGHQPGSKTLRVCEEDPLLLHGYQSKQTNFF